MQFANLHSFPGPSSLNGIGCIMCFVPPPSPPLLSPFRSFHASLTFLLAPFYFSHLSHSSLPGVSLRHSNFCQLFRTEQSTTDRGSLSYLFFFLTCLIFVRLSLFHHCFHWYYHRFVPLSLSNYSFHSFSRIPSSAFRTVFEDGILRFLL